MLPIPPSLQLAAPEEPRKRVDNKRTPHAGEGPLQRRNSAPPQSDMADFLRGNRLLEAAAGKEALGLSGAGAVLLCVRVAVRLRRR